MSINGKGCPGLHKIYCGEPKAKGQGYCKPHMREYQRNRYKSKVSALTSLTSTAAHLADETQSCAMCKQTKPNQLQYIRGFPSLRLVCTQCLELLNFLRLKLTPPELPAIINYLLQPHVHNALLNDSTSDTVLETEIKRRLEDHLAENYPRIITLEQAFEEAYDLIREQLEYDLTTGKYQFDPETNTIIQTAEPQSQSVSQQQV